MLYPQVPSPPTDSPAGPEGEELATWSQRTDGGLEIMHRQAVRHVAWHARGDYFSTVAPSGNTQVRGFSHDMVLLEVGP